MTYYTINHDGTYSPADPQPVLVPEDETTPWGALLVLNVIRDVLGVEPGQNVIDAVRSLKPDGKCKTVVVQEGYMVVKREPDRAMELAGGEALYGYPYGKAVEWCKEEKFEARAYEAVTAYRAMTQAGKLKPT